MSSPSEPASTNFIADVVVADNASGKHGGRVLTRFPPEPNGYLHVGHAKSICLNFGLAQQFGGACNLRFDDTNPVTEDVEYVESIAADVKWLGFEWKGEPLYASDYFEQLYLWAEKLITLDKAFVDELSAEQIAEYRGDFHRPGRPSPHRDRPVEDSLRLFRAMRAGEFADGTAVLRAKIDANHPNMNLRDPVIYRVKKARHHRTGDAWCIYPMYDYAHPLSDAIEGITHSVCTLEFEDHRPFYDWCVQTVDTPYKPQQIEFARLNFTYTVMSKRKLLQLVNDGLVDGWNDPRMPTLRGMRRRGVPPAAVRAFAARIGVSKAPNWIDPGVLDGCIRDELDATAARAMAVIAPLRVVLENHEAFTATLQNHPKRPELGTREIPLTREIFVERSDFEATPPKGFFRLFPGNWVRLRGAGFVRVDRYEEDVLYATWSPPMEHAAAGMPSRTAQSAEAQADSGGYDRARGGPQKEGNAGPGGAKVKGTIHWVSSDAVEAEVRLYDRLFTEEYPDKDDWKSHMNPKALEVVRDARVEVSAMSAKPGERFQFERNGYFVADEVDSAPGKPVWNRIVTLKDSWTKEKS